MSGIEVVALVAGIVSAFAGATTVYQKWRQERRGRRKEEANKELEQLVRTSGPTTQERYNDDFRRLGPLFARGDEIGRVALMEQLITLQQTVIALITSTGGPSTVFAQLIHPNHDGIFHASSSVRDGTLSALTNQYQRLLQSRPIEQITNTTDRVHIGSQNPTVNCPDGALKWTKDGGLLCRICQWHISKADRVYIFGSGRDDVPKLVKTKDGLQHVDMCLHGIFHYRKSGRDGYRCTICCTSLFLSLEEVTNHFATVHTWDELCGSYCTQYSSLCALHLN